MGENSIWVFSFLTGLSDGVGGIRLCASDDWSLDAGRKEALRTFFGLVKFPLRGVMLQNAERLLELKKDKPHCLRNACGHTRTTESIPPPRSPAVSSNPNSPGGNQSWPDRSRPARGSSGSTRPACPPRPPPSPRRLCASA